MTIILRPCSEADCEAVVSIWFESWRSAGVAIPDESIKSELKSWLQTALVAGWSIHVAHLGNEMVAFLALHGDKLEQLFVAPHVQGRGIGKELLDFAKRQRPGGFHLTTALESRSPKFYEREGLRAGETAIHPRFGHKIVRYDWVPSISRL